MTTYKEAGVDIEAGSKAVELMKKYVKETYNKNVVAGIGGFGGMFELGNYKNPVLVSSIDGVGTKLKIAFMLNKHDTVGQCLVNHCVNDILVQGAVPLFFLDYFGVGKLNPKTAAEIVKGFSKACKENNCVLIGGETAEMPGIYNKGEYDLAGCIVGVVEKDEIVDGSKIQVGDKVIGLLSNGLHTNGYSLARKVLSDNFNEELLKVHKSYLKIVKPLLKKIKGMAHITGGGLVGNIPRVLPKNVDVKIDSSLWEVPQIFKHIQKAGNVPEGDMWKTFNMGIGFVLIVDKDTKVKEGIEIGQVVEGNGKVILA